MDEEEKLTIEEKRDILLENLYDTLSNLIPGTTEYDNTIKEIRTLEEIRGKEAERISNDNVEACKRDENAIRAKIDKQKNRNDLIGHIIKLFIPIIGLIGVGYKLKFYKNMNDENREYDINDAIEGRMEERDNRNRRNRVMDSILNINEKL